MSSRLAAAAPPGSAPSSAATDRRWIGGVLTLAVIAVAIVVTSLWHLTQGTSGVGAWDLLRYLGGGREQIGGVPIADIFSGSRLPRLAAGIGVGLALGVAGALLQSVTRNALAAPDTVAVTAGSYFALTAIAAFGLTLPLWASSSVAVLGGLLAAGVVLGLAGFSDGASTRLILAGSAIAMALDAATATLLILFKDNTTGLFAWGSGSLAQLNMDASLKAAPVIVVMIGVALGLSRRLDVLALGDDAARTVGVAVSRVRLIAVMCAVLLTAVAVTLAGPIAFIGLAAPVAARLVATRVRALTRHLYLILASGLFGALLILVADVVLRAVMGAQAVASIPTGIPTSLLGAVVIMVLAMRLRDSGASRTPPRSRVKIRSRGWLVAVITVAGAVLVLAALIGLLAGSLWLRTGDIALWLHGRAPALISHALADRSARTGAAVVAGTALALAGTVVQASARNPLAEPGVLGITAGAGLGAVIVVTAAGGSRTLLIVAAVAAALATFVLITALSWRRGLSPDRFLLVGIGCGFALSDISTFLLLRADPWDTPRILTWLSGTTYGRTFADVLPVLLVLAVATPLVWHRRRELDLPAIDEDTPVIFGVRRERTRLALLALAAVTAAMSVVAIGVVGFVGLVAPHLARSLVGSRHQRVIPTSMLLGAALVCIADTLGRTIIAPSQIPAGLMMALLGAPYFVWLLRRSAR